MEFNYRTQKHLKENEAVLVWCKIYGRFIATYEDIGAGKNWGNWRDSNGNLRILPPIYWKPLPEPPIVG